MIPFMLDGTYNPGQLQIVREILPGTGDFDTANFSGPSANYTIIVDDNGTPLDGTDNIVTVIDNTVPVGGLVSDGIDRLTHIERLQFSDQSISFAPELNADPVGQLVILDAATNTPDDTPTEGQLLRASIAGVTDADNPRRQVRSPGRSPTIGKSKRARARASSRTYGWRFAATSQREPKAPPSW